MFSQTCGGGVATHTHATPTPATARGTLISSAAAVAAASMPSATMLPASLMARPGLMRARTASAIAVRGVAAQSRADGLRIGRAIGEVGAEKEPANLLGGKVLVRGTPICSCGYSLAPAMLSVSISVGGGDSSSHAEFRVLGASQLSRVRGPRYSPLSGRKSGILSLLRARFH